MSPDLLQRVPPNTDAISMSEHLIEALVQDPCLLSTRSFGECSMRDPDTGSPDISGTFWQDLFERSMYRSSLRDPLANLRVQISIQGLLIPLQQDLY